MPIITRLAAALLLVAASCGTAYAEDDLAAGKSQFNKCAACHSIKAGENKIGPSLNGIVGRPSHSVAGFNYSPAMQAYTVTWDEATLDHYLIDPRATVPGTKMIFPGLRNEADRKNLIAYLATLK